MLEGIHIHKWDRTMSSERVTLRDFEYPVDIKSKAFDWWSNLSEGIKMKYRQEYMVKYFLNDDQIVDLYKKTFYPQNKSEVQIELENAMKKGSGFQDKDGNAPSIGTVFTHVSGAFGEPSKLDRPIIFLPKNTISKIDFMIMKGTTPKRSVEVDHSQLTTNERKWLVETCSNHFRGREFMTKEHKIDELTILHPGIHINAIIKFVKQQ